MNFDDLGKLPDPVADAVIDPVIANALAREHSLGLPKHIFVGNAGSVFSSWAQEKEQWEPKT